MEGKKPSHLLFCFSHVSRRQDLQEAGVIARFWYRSCFPFIGVGALIPTASSLRAFQQPQSVPAGPVQPAWTCGQSICSWSAVMEEQKYLRLSLCKSLQPATCLLSWAQ